MNVVVRKAVVSDLASIVAIYNEAILEGGSTADTSTYTVDEKLAWFELINSDQYGIYVLLRKKEVLGYFNFSPWRKGRKSLDGVREISFYLKSTSRGKGLGNLILENAFRLAQEKNITFLIAIILDVNIRSKQLLEKWGFELVGSLPNIVNYETKILGQFILLKRLVV